MDIETGNQILRLLQDIKVKTAAHSGQQVPRENQPGDPVLKLLEEINREVRVIRKAQIRDGERLQALEKRLNILTRPGSAAGKIPHQGTSKTPARQPSRQPSQRDRMSSELDDITQMLNRLKDQM